MNKKTILAGLILTFILFGVHLFLLDDYGLTWDFHHHFFAGMNLLKQPITPEMTANLPFTEPDPRGTVNLPFGPLMSIAPVATYLVFFKWLGILAFDNAYNLSIVASGTLGIFILYLFLLEAFGFITALAGFTILALLPRYFGDLHNNMKDVPQAAAFTLAIWLFWRLARYRRLKDLIAASIAFAIAFNTKVNTMMVPVIAGIWLILNSKHEARNPKQIQNPNVQNSKRFGHWNFDFWSLFRISNFDIRIYIYFLTAPLAAFLLWSVFWPNPVGQLLYIPKFFIDNTQNIEVLINGAWYCSGSNVPWWYALWYLAITTPLPILVFFLIGLIGLINQMRKNQVGLLLLLWFFLPLARYALPRMGVIDGIRHFEEVVFPLAAIAAIGATTTIRFLKKFHTKYFTKKVNNFTVVTLLTTCIGIGLVWLIVPIVRYHPFQISYYNEFVGGIKGAFGKYDIDYWGGPQKKAIEWLNVHAPKDSNVHVVMAADVAGTYLRSDLRAKLNTTGYDGADYVVGLNRQGFFYRYFYIWEYMLRRKAAYVVENQGVPIVWVYDNKLRPFPRALEWWQGEDPCIRKYWN